MVFRLWRCACQALVLLVMVAGCSSSSDAPRGQVLLFIDTDAPIASMAITDDVQRDASVDTVRIETLGSQDETLEARDIPAPDAADWPVSLGIGAATEGGMARMRIRAFRARNSEARTDPTTGKQVFDPVAAYTIDRTVDVPLPPKGLYAFRIILRAECRGNRTDFVKRTTCVDSNRLDVSFRDGIEALDVTKYGDSSTRPPRPQSWWPGNEGDCPESASNADVACIPGGFFMMGNHRVVGFGSLLRADATPEHPVVIHPFLMDRREMTAGRYSALTAQGKAPIITASAKDQCTWSRPPDAASNLPMNCVRWEEAQATCMRLGGRLPTEAEWEYVAAGRGRGYLFVWGDEAPDCKTSSLARWPSASGLERCTLGIEPAASHDRSHPGGKDETADTGVIDLAGSVSEWMYDSYKPYSQDALCWERDTILVHPVCDRPAVTTKSVRGGNWAGPMEVAYSALRDYQESDRYTSIGFRCVYPLPGQIDPARTGSNAGNFNPKEPPIWGP